MTVWGTFYEVVLFNQLQQQGGNGNEGSLQKTCSNNPPNKLGFVFRHPGFKFQFKLLDNRNRNLSGNRQSALEKPAVSPEQGPTASKDGAAESRITHSFLFFLHAF